MKTKKNEDCTCRTEVQKHDCMYYLRSNGEAEQDYKENLAPPEDIISSIKKELHKERKTSEDFIILRNSHVQRAQALGIDTIGKSYHDVVSEVFDYIEGMKVILKQGHL